MAVEKHAHTHKHTHRTTRIDLPAIVVNSTIHVGLAVTRWGEGDAAF